MSASLVPWMEIWLDVAPAVAGTPDHLEVALRLPVERILLNGKPVAGAETERETARESRHAPATR